MKLKKVLSVSAAATLALTNVMGVSAATMKNDLFNADYYASAYADVKEACGDDADALWNHFITSGIAEGRSMNELLDVVKYREKYTDLAEAFGDNWDAYVEHYLNYGAKEGRDSGTDFNILDYAAKNADLQAAFGDDVAALWNHYQTDGATEGRGSKYAKTVFTKQEAVAQKPQETVEQKPQETVVSHELSAAGLEIMSQAWSNTERDDEITVSDEYEKNGYKEYETTGYDAAGNMLIKTHWLWDYEWEETLSAQVWDAAGKLIFEFDINKGETFY